MIIQNMNESRLLKLLHDKEVDIKLLRSKIILSAKDYNYHYDKKHSMDAKNKLVDYEFKLLKGWAK